MTKEESILIAKLRLAYRKNPIAFCRDLLDIELSQQQEPLFLDMIKWDARVVVKSATGTGKTTLLSLVILHQLLTEYEINILATSPSAGQLQRGLRKELGKMHGRIKDKRIADLFEIQRDAIFLKDTRDTHICFLVTGSAENEENLAGVHAKKVIIVIDEASGISSPVMDILKGNLTTEGSSMIQTSNPQRPSGPFYEMFENPISGYKMITLDAYGSPMISAKWISEMIETYGEDSDFVRVRIKGEFPRSADSLFFSSELIEESRDRRLDPSEYLNHPVVMGIDVARFGSDKSTIVLRQGYKILDTQSYSGLDTMEFTSICVEYYNRHRGISALIADEVGIGAGVVDRLKELGLPVVGINVGTRSSNTKAYFNLRAEVYDLAKEWLRYGDIPECLVEELRSIQYGFNARSQLQLMTKADMKKQGIHSPDLVDAFVFTFFNHTRGFALTRAKPRGVRKVPRWIS